MLVEEIEHHKLRGVTPEQFKEIEVFIFISKETEISDHLQTI